MSNLNPIRADKIFKKGDTGKEVEEIQELLNEFGFELVVNGLYDAKTHEAVNEFKIRHNLKDDHIVDNDTMIALKKGPQTIVNYKIKVRQKSIDVREGPGLLPEIITTVSGGTTLKIVEETKNGRYGRLSSGGWIQLDLFNVYKI